MLASEGARSLAMQFVIDDLEELLLCLPVASTPVPEQLGHIGGCGNHVGRVPIFDHQL